MTAERDLLLSLLRRLLSEGTIDADDVVAMAEDVEARGGEDHAQMAHLARLTVIEASMVGQPPINLDAERRRKEMVTRTAMIRSGKGDAE